MRTTVRSAPSAFIRLRSSLPGAYVAEALVGSGIDWMLFDTEHSPGDPLTVLAQLWAVARCQVSPVGAAAICAKPTAGVDGLC